MFCPLRKDLLPNAFRTSVRISVAVALAVAGFAHAQTTKSRHDLEHGAADARSRAAEARADEQALAGDIAMQSERIDVVESDIGGLGAELAARGSAGPVESAPRSARG